MLMQMSLDKNHFIQGLHQTLWHVAISSLAVAIAFALPTVARYILYEWWPRVEADTNLLLATELTLASALLLFFNFLKLTWENRQRIATARTAALVHARSPHSGWLSKWMERRLVRRLPPGRDAFIFSLTGYDTFVAQESLVKSALQAAYEIRVMLLNPLCEAVRKRVDTLPDTITLLTFHREVEASIVCLRELRTLGKKVSLRFYEQEPFWKIAGVGDHVWVQHVHTGYEMREQPEYVFALQHDDPRQGLFVPFYSYFLRRWSENSHPEYDFESNELVYRDALGNETRRTALGLPGIGAAAHST